MERRNIGDKKIKPLFHSYSVGFVVIFHRDQAIIYGLNLVFSSIYSIYVRER